MENSDARPTPVPASQRPEPRPEAASAARSFRFGQVQRELGFLDRIEPEEAKALFAMICRLPLGRNLGEVAAFVDHVWFFARNAEFRTGPRRITGLEMDAYRERLDLALRGLLETTRDLATRAGLTEILLRHRRLLVRNGLQFGAPRPRPAAPGAEGEKLPDDLIA